MRSYKKFCFLFRKKPFPATVQTLVFRIGQLGERRLKPKTIKSYLGGLKSLRIDRALVLSKLDVYSHPVLHRIIIGIKRFRGEGKTRERQLITRDILLRLLLQFKTHTLEGANLHVAFCLAFAGFLQIREFTNVDRGKYNFGAWNLTRRSIFFLEDRLFLVLSSSKTDLFRKGVILTISAATDNACALRSLQKSSYQRLCCSRCEGVKNCAKDSTSRWH